MKNALITAVALSAALSGAAVAQQVPAGIDGALAHFNQSIDDANERAQVNLVDGETTTSVSTRSGDLATAFDIFNADADSTNDLRGVNGATVVSGTPAYGAAIFDRLAAENDDN